MPELHGFLSDYYEKAILKAREHLDKDVPVVLFEWPALMWMWPWHRYPYEKFGKVMWDAHSYHGESNTVEGVLSSYNIDLGIISLFQATQQADVIVGEFGVSNL